MPSITFELPHWIYWSGLVFVPLLAMYIVRKQKGKNLDGKVSIPIAYMLWLSGGFVGLHRFYVRNSWGLIYIPVFVALLLANVQVKSAMNTVSAAKNNLSIAEFESERTQADKRAERRQQLEAGQTVENARLALEGEKARLSRWNWITRILAASIALMLLVDAFLLPKLIRRCADAEARTAGETTTVARAPDISKHTDPALNIRMPSLDFIDRINGYTGDFVCFWSIIAVFVYYYEVLARYVFNSPTNWAHEGMFLMFGMQYMLAAGFALREDSHVRVDVIYLHLPDRAKAAVDMITSVFFFVFAIALIWTGWIFAADSIQVWEVSFTEWSIHYWPVKATMVIGPVLLFLQGFARLIKEVAIITGKKA